ncbi:hypothetical protein EOPP23_04755 [Endozoicomonas sp. OPT23]|uniref:PilW family protein n=1 Tax=Endozoicomonas sp. OPT23 TaxID=2072845 RepID=UPI00129ADF56|nr:PilW family protein [Endozoicomonas sp. OPT23]MRI32304.1 hypothetical protein [Endozoicomonas sp. OPT23]
MDCFAVKTKIQKQSGLSLIELMIASTLSLMLLTGVAALYINNLSVQQSSNRYTQLDTNAHTALTLIARSIGSSGYANGAQFEEISVGGFAVASDCNGIASALDRNNPILTGRSSNNIFTCVTDARTGSYMGNNASPSDWLLVKGPFGPVVPPANLQATGNYIIANTTEGRLFRGDTAPTGYPDAVIREYHFSLFYLNASNELILLRLAGNGLAKTTIASNIDSFRIRLGLASNATGNITRTVEAPANPAGWTRDMWRRVRSIELYLLAQSTPDNSFTNNNTYQLGDINVRGGGDNRHRLLASNTVYLYNQAIRQQQ